MNRGFAFTLVVPIVFISLLSLHMVNHVQEETQLYDEYILSFAVDYATEAAVEEMLMMSHLGTDYAESGRVNVDPEVGRETFLKMMCLSYGLPQNGAAFREIECDFLPIFCVAAYDGYYLYEYTQDRDGGWYLQASQKHPYTVTDGDKSMALNLGSDTLLLLQDGHLTKETVESQGLTSEQSIQRVNAIICDAITWEFQKNTGREGEFIYLPSDLTTFKQVNPVKGPSIIAFIDGWDYGVSKAASAFSVGGARISDARPVAAYYVNGEPLYCYADLLPAGFNIYDMYTSVEAAAGAGFYCDLRYMT